MNSWSVILDRGLIWSKHWVIFQLIYISSGFPKIARHMGYHLHSYCCPHNNRLILGDIIKLKNKIKVIRNFSFATTWTAKEDGSGSNVNLDLNIFNQRKKLRQHKEKSKSSLTENCKIRRTISSIQGKCT